MEKVNCRLKMLITDACSNAPRPPIVASSFAVETVSKSHIKHLFGQHEGFLHLNAASEGQYSWSHLELGSFFTIALMELISDISDTNRDGFVAWKEVFEVTRDVTDELFKQVYPHLPQSKKIDMQRRGIKSQTAKAYSLPQRMKVRPPGSGAILLTASGNCAIRVPDLMWSSRQTNPHIALMTILL